MSPEPVMPVIQVDGTCAITVQKAGLAFVSDHWGNGALALRYGTVVWQWFRACHQWGRYEKLRIAWFLWTGMQNLPETLTRWDISERQN